MSQKHFEVEQIKRRKVGARIEAMKKTGQATGSKFRYAYSKNLKLLTDEIEAYQEIMKPDDKFLEYQNKLNVLRVEHAKKEEKTGAPMSETNNRGEMNYVFENARKYDSEYKKLKAEYQSVIDEREKQIKEFDSYLDGTVSFSFHKITDVDVPESLTAEQYSGIFFMIADAEEKENVVPIKKAEETPVCHEEVK